MDNLTRNRAILHIGIETDKLISGKYVNEENLQELITEISTRRIFQVFMVAYQARKCFCEIDAILLRELPFYEQLYYEMEFFLGNEMHQLISALGHPVPARLDVNSLFPTLRELFNDFDYSMEYLEYTWHLLHQKMDSLNEVFSTPNSPTTRTSHLGKIDSYHESSSSADNQNGPFWNALTSSLKTNDSYHESSSSADNQKGQFLNALNSFLQTNDSYHESLPSADSQNDQLIDALTSPLRTNISNHGLLPQNNHDNQVLNSLTSHLGTTDSYYESVPYADNQNGQFLDAVTSPLRTNISNHGLLPHAVNKNGRFLKLLTFAEIKNNECQDPVETVFLRSKSILQACMDIFEVLREFRTFMLEYYELKCYILSVYHNN